ncbi:MAG: glycosyltransferase family 39 protein, partial [Elusimicrobia bacterium]|nr:glycosyltransferase family 39 protein [Elusimicrobiota bacterium]
LFLSGTILLVGLGRSALWDRDETEYAQATLEMAQKNEWLIPALEGKPFLEKPIFLYWMTRLSLHFFGTSEFAFRLPSALFGMGICAVTYILGALLWGHGPALFSASILATTFLFTGGNKLLMTDPFFLFFTTCSLLFYILSLKRKEKASLYFALNYCVLGLAVLCKGPIGLFPVPIFIFWEWLMKEEKSWVRFMKENCLRHLAYLSLTLLISAPWFIYSSFKEKGEMSNFVIQENILRFMEGSEGHSHPFLYYIPILLLGFFPWTFFLISYFRKEWVPRRDQGTQMNSEVLLLTLWACFLYLFFSLSAHKLPHYLLPMLPPLSCLAGKFWHDQIQSGSFPKWPFTWTLAVSLCLFFLTVSIAFFRPQYAGFDLSFPFLVLSAGVGVGLYWISKNERQKSWLSLLTGSWAFYWALSIWALPQIDRQRVMKPIGLAIQKHVSSDDSLFGFRVSEPSLFIYGGRLFPKIENEPLDTLLNQEKKTFVLISEKQLEKSAPQSAYTILEKKEGFAENGGETTLLLISNQTPSKGQP